jgi:hypothetical protein
MFIKRPRTRAELALGATARDREALDFMRLWRSAPAEGGPVPGLPFTQLLRIASEVCHRPITELGQIRTQGEVSRIKERIRRMKNGR